MLDPEFSNQEREKPPGAHWPAAPAVRPRPCLRRVGLLHRRAGQAGFTLLQVIGAMLVAAILAAILFAAFGRQYHVRAVKEENENLAVLADGLRRHILSQKTIPDHTGLAPAIAQPIGWRVEEVLTNVHGNARAYLIDPALRIGTAAGILPYTQTIAGSLIKPISPRLMIVSSLSLRLPVSSGVPSTNDFTNIWNTAESSVPPGWPSEWERLGDDLKIKRIDLEPLFKQLLLANFDSPTSPGTYSIDSQGPATVPTGGVDTYFIEGSLVGFFDRLGTLESSQPLNRDSSFLFERSLWRGSIFERNRIKGLDAEKMAFFFTGFPGNPNAKFGATQQQVVNAMLEYLDAYAAWVEAGFPTVANSPIYSRVKDAQTSFGNVTDNLIFKP